MKSKVVAVSDSVQSDYSYELTAKEGVFDPDFKPDLTPIQMLEMGVFGGAYFDRDQTELPAKWFDDAKLSLDGAPDKALNFFEVSASQPLKVWQEKGWIYQDDPRGWFQWYCRYYLGRRLPDEDLRQIKRWKAMTRHLSQVKKYCSPGDLTCRRRQRQALLHWAYDGTKI